MSTREEALEWKAKGNASFKVKNFEEAAEHYSKAIECDGTDAVFYSNRSGCYTSLEKYDEAI